MATAAVEERQLLKTLRWYDGFVIALANPGFLLGSLGFSVGDLGGWGAALLWGISAVVAVFINTIYSELATMFPEKSGGLALYAHEAWRKYTTLIGPVATFGYWIGWSVVLSVNGLFVGSIIQGAWFSGEPGGSYLGADGYFSVFGLTQFGLPAAIAIGLILAVWLFNVYGARVGVTFGYVAGALLMIPLFVMMILPFVNGSFDGANLQNNLNNGGLAWGGLQLALVWLWLMCWSAWGVDVCATFAPEYKDTVRDTKLALRSAALFSMFVYILLPIAFVGGAGAKTVSGYDYVGGMLAISGTSSALLKDVFVVCIVASFVITMNSATADGGRALFGISRDGMTIRELGVLNRHSVPGNAMTVDMVVNILFVLLVGNIFGVLAASNLGYVLAHMFALSGYVLLRRDRPDWPRPIKLGAVWTPIAGILAVWCLILTIVGFGWFQNAAGGYGGTKEKVIGLGVLVVGLLLFFFRRIVQDKEAPHWREDVPLVPDAAGAGSRAG
ncbi:Amino acid permease [Gaiella occulta]|uniref:Amino acid permease n=1 Tax=Gaiella occulta TaxID=1002870 RepID=A0A7M2Z2I2_9ACTN|nr:APC family permease [Gaiella occulta]RDI76154.1 Amino acid permease [Gaiella occulta]